MNNSLIILFVFILGSTASAQKYNISNELQILTANKSKTDSIWGAWIKNNKIPLTYNDSAIFLYRGEARTVKWMGDFNAWGYQSDFQNSGKKISGTDIWYLKTKFPIDARLDYKILINDKDWILDPANNYQQWSGVGGGSPNSELRMPAWKEKSQDYDVPYNLRGQIKKDILFNSKSLGYQIMYSVYVPNQEFAKDLLPIAYITDGYEYMHERMGNMVQMLDYLIANKKIKPIIAVFIDHREPVNRSNNKRMQELAMNSKYLNFFTDEFIPQIEINYPVTKDHNNRAILGTSMGGLTAAYFAISKPDVFGLAGIQSPAFWFKPEIYALCDNPNTPPIKIAMTSGLINDSHEGTRKMKDILDRTACTYQYIEVNEGHSWGNWKGLLDEILIFFFGLE
jgi:enterochelin esterase-like enzyme/predicted small secreted protein